MKKNQQLSDTELANLLYFAHRLADVCIQSLHWKETAENGTTIYLRPREKDCLYWAAQGKTASDTADILSLKPDTVKKYIKTSMSRLDSKTKTQAVIKALELGLLDLTSRK